jgi:glycosyl transferase family 1
MTEPAAPRPTVLFLTSNTEDYLSNSLFHGLRTLLGERVVDFPKSEISYASYPHLDRIYGRGFTLYGLLDDIPIDRTLVIDRARHGGFDLIVFGDIQRCFGSFVELLPALRHSRVAFLDGGDFPAPYPYASWFWRRLQWWTLPRAHRRGTYFKRELTDETAHRRYFMLLPRRLAGRLPFARSLRPIAFSIPEEWVVAEPPPKSKQFNAHVVDEEVAARIGGTSSYAFDDQREYYADLQASRFGITSKRAGWDALRHYEIAANGCVPCFRDLDRKPSRCAPHGLEPGRNCLAYSDADDLLRQVDLVSDEEYAVLQRGALDWARANTTRRRAEEFLRAMGFAGA